jgi:hypothetical protein
VQENPFATLQERKGSYGALRQSDTRCPGEHRGRETDAVRRALRPPRMRIVADFVHRLFPGHLAFFKVPIRPHIQNGDQNNKADQSQHAYIILIGVHHPAGFSTHGLL